jgi:enoyl reductase-like protein
VKFIGGLWEHLKRLWQSRNDIYHQDNEGTITRYKLKELEREMEKLWARHTELLPKLQDFQKQHFDSMKARNYEQLSLKYIRMTQKLTDLESTAISSGILDGEQEWDNGAMTQLSRAGIVANVMLHSFGTISLDKSQLK